MSRKFKTANYEETLNQTICLGGALPPQHLKIRCSGEQDQDPPWTFRKIHLPMPLEARI